MSPSRTYEHEALQKNDSIRLLWLEPALSSDMVLQCQLIETELSAAPDYEALSYVWGADAYPQTLRLPSGYLKITDSLASALQALRSGDGCRLLWVDAVCINQHDGVEKAQQVARMASIYGNASKVVAWLGEDPRVSLNVSSIIKLAEKAEDIGLQSPEGENRETILKWAYGDSEKGRWTMGVMSAVDDAGFPSLYQSSWFTRMWIVQEALLARNLTLHFGTAYLDWDIFENVMMLMQAINTAIRYPMTGRESFVKYAWPLIEVRDHWLRSKSHSFEPSSVTYYMHQFRRRGCKDDRDRVFALLGLLGENTGLDVVADYSKSVTQIYTEFAVSRLKLGNLGLLYDAGLWKRKRSGLRDELTIQASSADYIPTWIPDYRSDMSLLELAEVRFGTYFGEDPKVAPNIDFDLPQQPCRLTTQATLIDIITFVQPVYFVHDEVLRANDASMFLTCRRFCLELREKFHSHFVGRHSPNGEDLISVFASALVGGGTDKAYTETFMTRANEAYLDPLGLWKIYEDKCLAEDGEVYVAMQQELQVPASAAREAFKGVGIGFYSSGGSEASIAWKYHHHLVNILRRHWFFITDDGYAGLAPLNTTARTDNLAYIHGANVPFVLRGLGEDVSDHLLVGPCYIHGLMDGEAVKHNQAFSQGK
ncbi:MAG: hypothetical protein Q9169_006759, partial [Polycauliona sp. 2 TL-2023]